MICHDFIINAADQNCFNLNKESQHHHQQHQHKQPHRSTIHQFKRLLKPVFGLLMKKTKNTYKKNPQPHYFSDGEDADEISDNLANESLENEIFEEIDSCEDYAGVPVYSNNGTIDIVPVFRGQRYIPVHFAKTEAGTFFWSSMVGPDCDLNLQGDRNAISGHQDAELQQADRWAQA